MSASLTPVRKLRITMPFDDTATGSRVGGIRIAMPDGEIAYYLVTQAAEDRDDVMFHREGRGGRFGETHAVDMDFGSCDCRGYCRWKRCRHSAAAKKLREMECLR